MPTLPPAALAEARRRLATPEEQRTCKLCGTERPISRFPKQRGEQRGRVCRPCVSAKRKAVRHANPEAALAASRRSDAARAARRKQL